MKADYDVTYLSNAFEETKLMKQYSYKDFEKIKTGTIVDLGCGNGLDAVELAKLNSSISVVGVDFDDKMLLEAQKLKSKYVNLDLCYKKGTAYNLPFEDHSIAGLRTERMFQHLQEPQKAYKEISRVIKKDAPIIILDTDWSSINFYTKYLSLETKIQSYLANSKVNNGTSARQIYQDLSAIGVYDMQIKVFNYNWYSLEQANVFIKLEVLLDEMRELNLFSTDEYNTFNKLILQRDKDASFGCTLNIVAFTSYKL